MACTPVGRGWVVVLETMRPCTKGSAEGPDSAAKALLHILTSQSQATCSAWSV
jgi:hypothetical protein